MSLHTINRCDQCETQTEYDSIYAYVGTQQGVDGTEDHCEAVDLCPIHMRMALADLVAKMTAEQAAEWVRQCRQKKPPRRV